MITASRAFRIPWTLDAQGIVHFGYDETAVMNIKGVKVGLVGIYEYTII